ncbi:cytochrome ubiquinol oxidase subunit I [Bacillus horti]|uniref:Cytochrome d ubiquinol oxidase subunit I n=1 Tax=Caldalkalibacillus horti TaxID=77523 RepID=A0ABT9W3R5_9BACI|nr:cytochrome ubiquinol oxidase subunit I [Bacillus horti]MDQ0167888.1 cytochrome d ubiquinol oxidase subunit I [Bacillus horti]
MFEYDAVLYSRILTYLTLGFHAIFATIGVGIPVMIALAEWMGIKRNDPHYLLLARRWARGFVITVAIGVVTGTAIGLQLSLLWPSFMQLAGNVIGLPLFLETFAFFFEAIFLGIYLYTWDRFKTPIRHFLLVIPVVIGASASGFFISTVNAFMNTPQGFIFEDGALTNIQPLAAMFNPATPTKIAHVLSSAYLTSAFILAAIAAFAILKGRKHVYYKKALKLTMVAALIFAISTALIGDLSGKFLAKYQPEKLAAAEWHFETTTEAPLVIGGFLTEDNEIKYALEIPYALSILAHGSPTAEVIGLEEFPEEELPPLWVHYFFDLMVMFGIYLMIVSLIYVIFTRFKKWNEHARPLLWAIVAGGPFAMLAIEFGWLFAEQGRQPWILVGYMTTAEGATTSAHVDIMLYLFLALYTVLAVTCIVILRKMFRNHTAEEEIKERGLDKLQ